MADGIVYCPYCQQKNALARRGVYMTVLTKHSKERLKERCGLNKNCQNRIIEKVYECGITHKETKGNLNKWITSLYFHNCTANNIRLYGDKAYLFHENKLITVIQIPNNLLDSVHKIQKKGMRHFTF